MIPPLSVIATPGSGLLAQGDRDAALHLSETYDLLVLCALEFQPQRQIFRSSLRIDRCPIDDARLTDDEKALAATAADRVARYLRRGRRVLVTCFMGRNRSGLVSALALHKLHGCGGRTAAEIVRTHRENALTNPSFLRYLYAIPPLPPKVGRGIDRGV